MDDASAIPKLSQRQKQILDIVFRLGEASVSDIMQHLPESPTSGAVRRMLNLLYAKGAVDYRHDGAKKMYSAKVSKSAARRQALDRIVEIFFGGSTARTMASLLESSDLDLNVSERATLKRLIKKTKELEE